MYFLINHDTGVVESAETTEIATRLIDEWIHHGTDFEDISFYMGERRSFGVKTIRKSYIVSSFKTD